jgi:hypothetical protein
MWLIVSGVGVSEAAMTGREYQPLPSRYTLQRQWFAVWSILPRAADKK